MTTPAMRRFALIAMATVAGITFYACGGASGESAASAAAPADTNTTKSPRETGVPVSIIPAIEGDMVAAVAFSATVESEQTVKVYSQANGLVEQLFVEEGDRIEAGQVLVQLDDDDSRLALRTARIEYEKARQDSVRHSELFAKDLISRDLYEQATYLANRTRVAIDEAQLALTRTKIRSPVSGVVAVRNIELGDRVNTSSPVYEVVTMDDLVARVHVPGRHRPNLRVGQPAQITSDMLPGYQIEGSIRRISPIIDPQSGTVRVTVALSDSERKYAPGMFANVALITERQSNTILVPKEALLYDASQTFAFVVRNNKAHRTRLETGLSNAQQVQVLSGLERGDSVIIVGHEGLRDGANVRVIANAMAPIPTDQPQAAENEPEATPGTSSS